MVMSPSGATLTGSKDTRLRVDAAQSLTLTGSKDSSCEWGWHQKSWAKSMLNGYFIPLI